MWRGYGQLVSGGEPVAIGFCEADLTTLAKDSCFEGPEMVSYESGPIPEILDFFEGELDAGKHVETTHRLSKFVLLYKNKHFEEEQEYRCYCGGTFSSRDRRFGQFSEVGGEFRKVFRLSLGEDKIFEGLKNPLGIKRILIGPKANQSKIERYLKHYFAMHKCMPPETDVSKIPFV
ncbi:hypothetical protein NBRC116594_10440 [Shimia sp. NS0008-38b]